MRRDQTRWLWPLILIAISAAAVVVAGRSTHGASDVGAPSDPAAAPVVAAAVHADDVVVSAPVFVADVARDGVQVVVLPPVPGEVLAQGDAERVDVVRRLYVRYPGSPLVGLEPLMVALADELGLDYRLLPVITVMESSAGLHACGFNVTGYGSCRGRVFESFAEGLRVSAATLAGYGGDTAWKLCVWNQGATGCAAGLADNYVAQALWMLEEQR